MITNRAATTAEGEDRPDRPRPRPTIPTRALALLWTLAVLVLHSIPRNRLERIPGAGELVRSTGPDKVAHVALFVVLGLLWSQAFPWRPLTVMAAGVAYGIGLECYQGGLIPGRSCSPADVLADAVGIAGGIAVATCLRRRRRRD